MNHARARLDKIAIVVDDYDQAIAFFTKALAFELVEIGRASCRERV